ncbi:MAG: hypothetical protein QXO37_06865 [Candidatus Nitrosocaldaceae archaeon]
MSEENMYEIGDKKYVINYHAGTFRLVVISNYKYSRVDIRFLKAMKYLKIYLYGIEDKKIYHDLTEAECNMLEARIKETLEGLNRNENNINELFKYIVMTYAKTYIY